MRHTDGGHKSERKTYWCTYLNVLMNVQLLVCLVTDLKHFANYKNCYQKSKHSLTSNM